LQFDCLKKADVQGYKRLINMSEIESEKLVLPVKVELNVDGMSEFWQDLGDDEGTWINEDPELVLKKQINDWDHRTHYLEEYLRRNSK
jgi:hypothetical protein